MLVSIIAAMDRNRLIGNKNQLPWHLPADLAHFKQVTMGKPIVMGRKTYESIGRPLPGRTNIVLTRSPDFHPEGVKIANSLEQALEYGCLHLDGVKLCLTQQQLSTPQFTPLELTDQPQLRQVGHQQIHLEPYNQLLGGSQ